MTLANDLTVALPELFLALSAIVLLMLGVFSRKGASRSVLGLATAALVLALALVVLAPAADGTAFNGFFVNDGFARFMKGLVLIGGAGSLIMSLGYMEREHMARFEYPVVALFATVGMMMMVSANDLTSLYIGLELQNLSLYIMAAFRRDTLRSSEAGLKYFVLSALSSGLLLYGISLVYGFAGTTGFEPLAGLLQSESGASTGLIVGLVFVAAGLVFKVSAVPFHMWTPDVYEGAPTIVTAFFSVAPKVAAMALLVRVMMAPFAGLAAEWQQIIVAVSLASMLLGAFAGINQSNIKRLMAYSSIGHVGYALIGLAAGSEAGVRGLAIYLAIYIVMNIGTFACILGMRINGRMVENIDDLKGLSKTHPMMALAFAIFMFSMAGIPPLAGFFAKFYIFMSAIEAGLSALAIIGILSSVVAAFYYLRIIKLMYFDEPTEALDKPIGRELAAVLVVSSLAILLFFIAPGPLVNGAAAAAQTFFAG